MGMGMGMEGETETDTEGSERGMERAEVGEWCGRWGESEKAGMEVAGAGARARAGSGWETAREGYGGERRAEAGSWGEMIGEWELERWEDVCEDVWNNGWLRGSVDWW
jgi:hypothetical protein